MEVQVGPFLDHKKSEIAAAILTCVRVVFPEQNYCSKCLETLVHL